MDKTFGTCCMVNINIMLNWPYTSVKLNKLFRKDFYRSVEYRPEPLIIKTRKILPDLTGAALLNNLPTMKIRY